MWLYRSEYESRGNQLKIKKGTNLRKTFTQKSWKHLNENIHCLYLIENIKKGKGTTIKGL